MESQYKISVIVPVYNVEKYLDRCLLSICNQTYKNIEIILVDDGSTDTSGAKCEEWRVKDDRIKVVHKKNAGLGYARNTGLDNAVGDYIAYVDSDDYIVEDTFERVIRRIEETKADVCYFGCIDVWEGRQEYGKAPEKLLYKGQETFNYVKEILGPSAKSTEYLFGGVSAWSGITKKSLIDEAGIRFPSERECLCEDIFYNLQVCLQAKIIAIEPSCLYCYWHNDNTLTTSYRENRFEAALRMYNDLQKMFITKMDDSELVERLCRSLMQNLIVCLKQEVIYCNKNGFTHMYKKIKDICENEVVQVVLRKYPINSMPVKQKLLFKEMLNNHIFRVIILVRIKTFR